MRLGIPLVITPEPALLEVTAGHATVIEGHGPSALARAVATARRTTPEALTAARQHVATFTWSHFAADVRTTLREVMEQAPRRRPAWARTRVRLAGTFAAATLALGGAAAGAYALTVPFRSAHASHPVLTTTTAPGTAAHTGSGSTQGTASTSPGQHPSTGSAPGARSSGSGSSGSTNGSSGSPPSNLNVPALPTVPTVTVPSVTVPTVPTVTVPGSACTTTTTVGTVATVPCEVPVP